MTKEGVLAQLIGRTIVAAEIVVDDRPKKCPEAAPFEIKSLTFDDGSRLDLEGSGQIGVEDVYGWIER